MTAICDIPLVRVAGLSRRAQGVLARAMVAWRLSTWGDLALRSDAELSCIRGCGRKTLAEIRRAQVRIMSMPLEVNGEGREACPWSRKEFEYQHACSVCGLGVLRSLRNRCPYWRALEEGGLALRYEVCGVTADAKVGNAIARFRQEDHRDAFMQAVVIGSADATVERDREAHRMQPCSADGRDARAVLKETERVLEEHHKKSHGSQPCSGGDE